uniref:Uncharacterized protein n=1 Tax=Rhizophora mucronata TaxID=61149 RepID=A0A2P2NAN1_RHIMU
MIKRNSQKILQFKWSISYA